MYGRVVMWGGLSMWATVALTSLALGDVSGYSWAAQGKGGRNVQGDYLGD
jgi:hypothetical protein